uniref:Putative salivary kunitz domain protein n=1 Tax=Ixodes ricinus TaxID=34613 RepID=A0A0K8R6P5_IXORI
MRSCFIFCLLAMFYIASANAYSCSGITGVPCHIFCYSHDGNTEFKPMKNGTPCKTLWGKEGECRGGECTQNK